MGDPKRENQRRRGRTTPRKSCSQARQALWPCDRVKLKLTHCRFPADHAFGVARITIVFTPCLTAITAQIFLSDKTCFQLSIAIAGGNPFGPTSKESRCRSDGTTSRTLR